MEKALIYNIFNAFNFIKGSFLNPCWKIKL